MVSPSSALYEDVPLFEMDLLTPRDADSFFRDLRPYITKAALKAHRGSSIVEVDDIEAHVMMTLFEQYEKIKHWELPGLIDLANKIAATYASNERIDYMHFHGDYVYDNKIVGAYLSEVMWSDDEDCPDFDGRMDLRDAFSTLPLKQKQVLLRKFAFGEQLDGSGRVTASRAVTAITNRLNNAMPSRAASYEEYERNV